MQDESICHDERFSTTRLLFRGQVSSNAASKLNGEGNASASAARAIKREGGLRTKGFSKQDVSKKPLVTVITVVSNGAQRLEDTIRSVLNQSYDNVEYIVIDGGSTDGTLELIGKFGDAIDYWVSEPDSGVYDAMNKGLDAASGEWVNFMNAGDAFCSKQSIANTVREFSEAMVYYSDAIFYLEHGRHCYYRQVPCDAKSYRFIHQSCIYRKQLHSIHGKYIVANGITASDYLFFKSVPYEHWQKAKTVISKYYVGDNLSSGKRHCEQVYGADILFGNRSVSRTFAVYWLQLMKMRIRDAEKSILGRKLYLTCVEKYAKVRREEFWQDTLDVVEEANRRSIE